MIHNKWLSEKPEFTENCIVICANKFGQIWEYRAYQIEIDGYVKWLDMDGDEYGDISDMIADKFFTTPTL